MKNLKNLRARRLIIHITDQNLTTFVPATAVTPLDDNDFREFIEDFLRKTMKASATQAARFEFPDVRDPAGICRDLFVDEAHFISGSEELARKLLRHTNRSMSRGNLAVVLFDGELEGAIDTERVELIAIMKLDLEDRFFSVPDPVTGATLIQKQADSVPSKKEGLQKCAFVARSRWDGVDGYDMMLLDRQVAGGANFFNKKFLVTIPHLSDIRRWEDFRKYGLSTIDDIAVSHGLAEDEVRTLKSDLIKVVNRKYVDIEEWVDELETDQNIRDAIKAKLLPQLIDTGFTPPDTLRLKDRMEYEADNNLILKVLPDHDAEITAVKEEVDGQVMYKVTFYTSVWNLIR